MKVYLAGKIAKGQDVPGDNWRDQFTAVANDLDLEILTPENPSLDEGSPWTIVGYDALQIQTADLVLVDASSKVGAGTAQEMVIAKYYSKPVVTILPRETHHRRSNVTIGGNVIRDWTHPFIAVSSDRIVESPEELADVLRDRSWMISPKSITMFDDAISAYRKWAQKCQT